MTRARAGARTGPRLAVSALAGVLLLAGCGASPENKVRDKIGDVTKATNDYANDQASAEDVFDALSSLDKSVTVNATDLGANRAKSITAASVKLRADVETKEAADEPLPEESPEPSVEPSIAPPPEPSKEPSQEPSEEPSKKPDKPSPTPAKSKAPKSPKPSKEPVVASASPAGVSQPRPSPKKSSATAPSSSPKAASRRSNPSTSTVVTA